MIHACGDLNEVLPIEFALALSVVFYNCDYAILGIEPRPVTVAREAPRIRLMVRLDFPAWLFTARFRPVTAITASLPRAREVLNSLDDPQTPRLIVDRLPGSSALANMQASLLSLVRSSATELLYGGYTHYKRYLRAHQ